VTIEKYIEKCEELREVLVGAEKMATELWKETRKNIGDGPDIHAAACVLSFDLMWEIKRSDGSVDVLLERLKDEAGL
jgi:predicted SpoU family rRNA methylase